MYTTLSTVAWPAQRRRRKALASHPRPVQAGLRAAYQCHTAMGACGGSPSSPLRSLWRGYFLFPARHLRK